MLKLKRIFTYGFIFLFSILILSSCAKEDDINYKHEKIEFENLASGYYNMPAKYLDTYYVENSETKYVDVSGFFKTLDGFYRNSYIKKSISKYRNIYTAYLYVSTGSSIEYASVTFDWINNEIKMNNPVFLNVVNTPSSVDFMAHLSGLSPVTDKIVPVVYKLNDYGFDIFFKDGKCLVPLSIMNTIFLSPDYYNIYYNGEKYYGIYYDITSLDKETYNEIKTCKLNNEEQTKALREETYNQLRFVMDYYYGLKEYKNIESFDTLLDEYKEDILSLDIEKNREAYFKFFVNELDELHTRLGAYSFYNDASIKPDNWNPDKTSLTRIKYKLVQSYLQDLRPEDFDFDSPSYETKGQTLFIYMPSFNTGSIEELNSIDSYKYDSYECIKRGLSMIDHSTIRNVVLDLSLNGGGNVAALFRALGFLSDNSIDYTNYNAIFQSRESILIDVDSNGDGSFDDKDSYSYLNWYILTSYNTFSAANSFAALAKSMGAFIIGQKTGGGMCSVLPIVLADSTTVEMSSAEACQMIKEEDGTYSYIEGGVDVDFELSYEKFYDYSYIDSLIHV